MKNCRNTSSMSFALASPYKRHYNSDLSIWLSVDPMSDKYPSTSPYTYCGNNPVVLKDPNGREVEYASYWDKIIVGLERIFNSYFRKTFRELKESSETYVFRKNSNGSSYFSCEGTPDNAKLYINYGMGDEQKRAKETIFSQLCHESEHARQFEHGELGFSHKTKNFLIAHPNETKITSVSIDIWEPIAYDLNDEIKAHDASIMGFRWRTSEYSAKGSVEKRKEYLKRGSTYRILPEDQINIPFKEKRKDSYGYYLPFKK